MKDYKIIKTEDGSFTVHSPLYDESCHSLSGAIDETYIHYIKACEVESKESLKILEVGFGTGLGFMETVKYAKKPFKFVSLEIDENMIHIAKKNYDFLKDLKKTNQLYELKNSDFDLTIILGDARTELKKFYNHPYFNAIYQDAFSPKRNSILWTYEWFLQLRKISLSDCIMSTYSSSSSIRKSMVKAGWKLNKGEKFGTKRSSTRARLFGNSDPEILAHLERSPAPTLMDENAKDYKL